MADVNDPEEWNRQMTRMAIAGGIVMGGVLVKKALTPAPAPVRSCSPFFDDSFSMPKETLSEYNPKVSETTTDRTVAVPIHYPKEGPASEANMPAETLSELLEQAVERCGDKPAMRTEVGIPNTLARGEKAPRSEPLDKWKTWTFQEYSDEINLAAKGFIQLGLKPFDAVNIFGFNSPQWFMAELGAICSGGIAAGIYPTDTPDQVYFKARHSGASIAVCENLNNASTFLKRAKDLPALKAVIVWDPSETFAEYQENGVTVMTWEGLKKCAARCSDATLAARKAAQKPGNVCTYIYTSGTTGDPKAVMVTHDNIIFCSKTLMGVLKDQSEFTHGDERVISYLPLSHVAGMMVDICMPLCLAALGPGTACACFARSYDLKAGTIGDRLRAIRPTLFMGVPRVWEKVAEKMKAMVAANPITGVKLKLAKWAKGKGLEHQRNCQMGGSGEKGFLYGLAKAKVLDMVRQKLGLDACKFAATAAAPISTDTLEYFGALGIQINEAYGMSECCGATTFSTDEAHIWGSCGWAPPAMEVAILDEKLREVSPCANLMQPEDASQGEICYRGRHIMAGYMANPDLGPEHVALIQKKTNEAIAPGGWLRSGDKGTMDARGMVKITGRYKELIIGAGGENIAPVPLEDNIKRLHDGIANVMMVGDKRKYNVALLTLKAKGATGVVPGGNDLDGGALDINPSVTTITGACEDPTWIKSITDAIAATNKNGACCPSNAAKIQKFTILPHDFSSETDEFTPTYKLKRSVVAKKYAKAIEAMYDSKEVYVPCQL